MRTEMTLELLCQALQTNCGDMLHAAKQCGVSLMFIEQWRRDDTEVDARIVEASRVGNQGLVSAAIQRAVRGVEEDVYYKGEVVGSKTNYSDGLLTTLLKAKVPEFKADADGAVHVSVNVANIMPRADTYEQWLTMREQTFAQAALPAPPLQVTEAEFTEVPEPAPELAFAGITL